MIGLWFGVGIICVIAGVVGIYLAYSAWENDNIVAMILTIIITIIALTGVIYLTFWYTNNTADGNRLQKDWKSQIDNGLQREITITAEDGREIFHYEGKVDIETDHDDTGNYILFESEEGQRYIIYYGITDTVMIIEKAG